MPQFWWAKGRVLVFQSVFKERYLGYFFNLEVQIARPCCTYRNNLLDKGSVHIHSKIVIIKAPQRFPSMQFYREPPISYDSRQLS